MADAIFNWFRDLPLVSRTYLLLCTLTSIACALDFISPLNLYFNAKLIAKGQVWRLVTTFLYFGQPGLDFALHMFFLNRYSRLLEESPEYIGRTGKFTYLYLYGMVFLVLVAPFLNITFFGNSLSSMLTYIWARRNGDLQLVGFFVFHFRAAYLPWVLVGFSLALGHNAWYNAVLDLLGIVAGHLYFYMEDIYPQVARIRGWKPIHVFDPPTPFAMLFGDDVVNYDELPPPAPPPQPLPPQPPPPPPPQQ